MSKVPYKKYCSLDQYNCVVNSLYFSPNDPNTLKTFFTELANKSVAVPPVGTKVVDLYYPPICSAFMTLKSIVFSGKLSTDFSLYEELSACMLFLMRVVRKPTPTNGVEVLHEPIETVSRR